MLLKFIWITKIGGNNNKFWKSPEINGSGFCMIQILVLVDNGGTQGMLSMVFTITT